MIEQFESGEILDKKIAKKNKNSSSPKKVITLAIILVSLSLLILIVGAIILINNNLYYKKELENSNLRLLDFQQNFDKLSQENALIMKELAKTMQKLAEGEKWTAYCSNRYKECKERFNGQMGLDLIRDEFPC